LICLGRNPGVQRKAARGGQLAGFVGTVVLNNLFHQPPHT